MREVIDAGGTKVRNTWLSQRTDGETVCKRNRGRARHNALKKFRARIRQQEVLQLLARWGWKPELQPLIAAHLSVHRSTNCRDFQTLLPLHREYPTCHQLWPRGGRAEEE